MTLPDESRVELGKVKKFVIGRCNPLIVAADNAEGGGGTMLTAPFGCIRVQSKNYCT